MKDRLILSFLFFVLWTAAGNSQTWIDSVRTIYSSSSRLHHPAFMKLILPYYYYASMATFIIAEDSGSVTLFKATSLNAYGSSIPLFQTILTRPASVGKIQFIGLYNNQNNISQQFLFWEEGSGSEQRIMYSYCQQDSNWETPQYLSPSFNRQQELVSAQTNISSYPSQYSFAIGWNEQDSLTLVNFLSDSIISKIRIATNAYEDSVHPALNDGMIAWETHNSSSMLRYATFNTADSIISIDTVTGSQHASHPVFLSAPYWSYPLHSLCWMKSSNRIGNIVGSSYNESASPRWETPTAVTNDSTGMNVPIFASFSPVVTKSIRSSYFYFDYLVYLRSLNDSNAFVRNNYSSYNQRREFWTANTIEGIDVRPDVLVQSVWIEKDSSSYSLRYHIGQSSFGAVDDSPLLPSTITLEQNYPNPFNPSTTIQYSLLSSGLVTLELFDILGRKIITLLNSKQSSGSHQVHWDANGIPSGTYFYRLKYNTTILAKKMLLIR
jgi:hypothetical protein